ncbi:MAG: alpha/beta hydrolase [Leptolyngbya foveolarum]|uniref:Alpha/beta hydrolase n=1 Tax=Leptolyngbya foveolarum TaxID=47253 RepID=A0A2W4U8L9_9CYAN|nr:MAG: alpha/beta hydrolase [Leptolyngbya foveolarum]
MTDVRVRPTAEVLNQTVEKIEQHLADVRSHPDQRPGAWPYYRFHPADEPILGTVLIFHGFSARPHQMWRLANYLYDNGFNFYQVTLAGHDKLNPAKNWPQIDLRSQYAQPLMQKVQQDPVLMSAMLKKADAGAVAPGRQAALLGRLFQVAPEMTALAKAIAHPQQPDFDRYFESSHTAFLTDAQQRLSELSSLPGPFYTVGLSVGGAVALGLAADQPARIEKVVAYSPLLRIIGEERRQYVQLAGPLDISETGWDPDLRFPVGALTAADYFGSELRMGESVDRLRQTPAFVVLTENEDAADVAANEQFFTDLNNPKNALYKYPSSAMVPHPMVDPTETSQGMSNLFWQSLYQETLRFLTTGTVEIDNLSTLAQSEGIARVPPM